MADILLVDDDGSVLLTLAIALGRLGHSVTMVSDAQKALEYLQSRHFEFLVSDVRMPGMSGFDLVRQAHHTSQPPRVILTSAYSNLGTPDSTVEAFLQKPVDIAHLNELLHRPPPEPNSTNNRAPSHSHEPPKRLRPLFSTGH